MVICRLVLGADMLEIETQAENDFIASQIFARNGVDNIWIGLTDFTREGRWEWTSTKEQPSFTNWGPGQPDNLGIAEKGQDCAYIRPDGSWDDESCDHNVVTHSVACETKRLSLLCPPALRGLERLKRDGYTSEE
nr:hypothetical protein BaRGS_010243 [Batillaria attramentaria]